MHLPFKHLIGHHHRRLAHWTVSFGSATRRLSRSTHLHADRRCRAAVSCTRAIATATRKEPKCTDEGVWIHEVDPSSDVGLGMVWGSMLWASGLCLSKYFAWCGEEALQSLKVLELGSGTGVVGLSLGKLGAQVVVTDFEMTLMTLLQLNIEANRLNAQVTVHELDWRDPSTFLAPGDHAFDLVVAADVLYNGADKLFARALASHLPAASQAIVASPYREDSPLLGFFEAADRLGLAFELLEENGMAAGGTGGDSPSVFQGSQFVPLPPERWAAVASNARFTRTNVGKIQIFRVHRVSGHPEDAARIRRVSRI
eukprot:gnl/TRDRNA2_/TRDRNA2_106369_c0_seq1.p1 gnl/TRDRNA2_/TRDRNA2_106369_c0~~gnl/TRDRNA2_/TRDRNA2_106369_c0_seq1.p1  ORF type:complete len:313 (+),score=40.66 gnl/TRDRNA2_/TRDRNA2_106369_c0_seq1:141-1079(+)